MNERTLAKIIENDIDLILQRLDYFKQAQSEDLVELEEEKISDLILPFRYVLDNLRDSVRALADEASSVNALRAITLLSVTCAQPDVISARLGIIATAQGIKTRVQKAASAVSNAWSSFIQQIQSILQSISSALWSLVSNYLNLKEWSVKGTISTPAVASLFGISGSAEIQFTFEK